MRNLGQDAGANKLLKTRKNLGMFIAMYICQRLKNKGDT